MELDLLWVWWRCCNTGSDWELSTERLLLGPQMVPEGRSGGALKRPLIKTRQNGAVPIYSPGERNPIQKSVEKKTLRPWLVAQLIRTSSWYAKVVGLVPHQDIANQGSEWMGGTTNRCFSLSFSLSLFLSFSPPHPSSLSKDQSF